VFAQEPAPAKPAAKTWAFDVASVRIAEPITPEKAASGKFHVGMTVNGNRVDIGYFSLADLIPMAFRVKQYQVSGPKWLSAQRFDIIAKMPEGATREQVPDMLQTLLADRFKLEFHRESKEHSYFALTVSKKGLKLKEAEPDPEPPKAETGDGNPSDPPVKNEDKPLSIKQDGKGMVISGGGQKGQMRITRGAEGNIRFESSKMKIDDFAAALSRFVDRPVIDQTELKGEYQIAFEMSLQDLMAMAKAAGAPIPPGAEAPAKGPADAASDPTGGSVFDSLEKLGLKLEQRKGPIELIVIDKVEKNPTDN